MTETVNSCPLCGSSDSSLFDQRQFHGYQVVNHLCLKCGLVFQSPRMTETELQEFYENGYRTVYQGQENPQNRDLAIQEARAQATLDFLPDHVNPARILDIGCSAGNLLRQFQSRYHAVVSGIEPGRMYREYALSSGLEVHSSLDELQKSAPAPFELVSMMHVLEHLPDPLEYLSHLRAELLAPQGWLLLEVPNLYAHDCFEVAHLVSFSAHTLKGLVGEAGYRVVKLRAHGKPRSTLIPLYLTMLAQAVPGKPIYQSLTMEPAIQMRRKLGLFQRKIAERFLPRLAWH